LSESEIFPKRTLIVDTKTPAVEINVFDASGVKMTTKSAVSRLELSLDPALYKIRYRIGNHVEDQLIELPPGENAFYLAAPPLPVQSAAPLPVAETDDESFSAHFAQDLIARHAQDTSKASSLFIFISAIRDSASDPSDLPLKPGAGVSIHTFSGEKIGDCGDAETRNGCCGLFLPIDPGNYILRVEMPPGRPVEQTLVAVEGWQLQFYTRITKSQIEPAGTSTQAAPEFAWQLDLSRSGVSLVRNPPFGLFDPEQMRSTAAARQSLAAGRSGAAPNREMINSLLQSKFDNPILGIYGGHLLAMQKERDLDLLREVVNNLIALVGNHPDVTALMIPLKDERAFNFQYSEPPMLRRSWSLIVDASTPEKDFRPAHSYSARIGGSLWGSSAWLAWRMPAELPAAANASPDLLPVLLSEAVSGKLSDSIRALIDSDEADTLTPIEASLAVYLDLACTQFRTTSNFSQASDRASVLSPFYAVIRPFFESDLLRSARNEYTPANVMNLTGLPYSTITEAAASLAAKLGVTPKPSAFSRVVSSMKFK
jgi:hypothetical protein